MITVDVHEVRARVGTVGRVGGRVTLPSISRPEEYTGPYTVTPRIEEQVLATSQRFMTDNVTVETIPVTYTTNIHGGKTVVIG